MASYVGILQGRSKGIGRLGNLGSNRGRASVGIGNHHGVDTRKEVIEVLGSRSVGPSIGVGWRAKGRSKVDTAIIPSKTRYIRIREG